MADRASVAVVGVGAIGGFFAAHLIAADTADVVLCVRRPFEHLVLETGDGELRCAPTVLTDPASVIAPVDWVLLATKAHQTVGAAAWLDALVGPQTRVVILQNGVEHLDRVRPLVAEDTELIPAVVYCGTEVIEPGHIVHRTNGFLIVAESPATSELAALYEPARAGIRLSDDFTTSMWQKLCANVVANGITALTGQRMAVMRRPDLVDVGRALVEECVRVGRAEGAEIDDDYVELLVRGIQAMPDDAGTSMLYDRLAGHPLEHDAKYAAVVRAGRRHGIPTPLHATFDALLGAISAAGGPSQADDPSGPST